MLHMSPTGIRHVTFRFILLGYYGRTLLVVEIDCRILFRTPQRPATLDSSQPSYAMTLCCTNTPNNAVIVADIAQGIAENYQGQPRGEVRGMKWAL